MLINSLITREVTGYGAWSAGNMADDCITFFSNDLEVCTAGAGASGYVIRTSPFENHTCKTGKYSPVQAFLNVV
jgi:hypothetical protein